MAKMKTNVDTVICLSRKHVGKGEVACNEQFLLFPQCFQKQSVVDVLKLVSMSTKPPSNAVTDKSIETCLFHR